MAGTEWRPVLNWYDLNIGQYVRFRQAAGWKKGHVSHLYDNSCTVTWNYFGLGLSHRKRTTLYCSSINFTI